MKEVGSPSDQAVILNTITHVKCALQDYGDAARNGAKAREIFKEHGPRLGEGYALMSQSSALVGQGNIRRAVAVAIEAQGIFKAEEKPVLEGEALEWLAQLYMMEGDNAKATTAARKGKDIFRDEGKQKEEALLTLRVAEASFMAAMEEGEPTKGGKVGPAWEKAAKDAKDALVVSRKTIDDLYIARGLYSVACVEVCSFAGDPVETINEAIATYQRTADNRGEAYMQTLLAQYYLKDEAIDLANAPLAKANELFQQCGDSQGEADAQGLIDLFGLGAAGEGGGDDAGYAGPSAEMLAATVTDVALSLMGVESLAQDTPLMDAGLDSLASVEFQNTLQKEFTGVSLPATLIFDFPSVKTLTDFIYQGLREAGTKALK
jgi:acyl carrier protein